MSLTLKSFGSPWKQAIKDVERETGQEAVLYRESYQQFKNTFEGCVRGQSPNVDAKQAWKRMYNESMKVSALTGNFKNLEANEVAAGMTIVNVGLEMVKGHAFMTKFAEQLADRYEAIDKPMLMRSLSRLFQVQKSVLTATDLESKAKELAKDEGFAMMFAMDKKEFLETVQLVESKIDRVQAEVEMLQGGGSTSAFQELMTEGMQLQGGAKDCEDLLKKECIKRNNEGKGDCRWVGKGESYTNQDGEKVKVEKGKCKPFESKVTKERATQRYNQIGVFFALLIIIASASYLFTGITIFDTYGMMEAQLASLDEKFSDFVGFSTQVGSFITYITVLSYYHPATAVGSIIFQGLAVAVASATTGELVKEGVKRYAEQAMMFEAPVFYIEFLTSIVIGIWAVSELISIYGFKSQLRPKVGVKDIIGPAVGAMTQYGIKYSQNVKDPVLSMFMGLLTMVLVMFFPWAISAVKAGFGAMKGCFSKGQKSAMTREVNNRRRLGTEDNNNNVPKKKKPEIEIPKLLELEDQPTKKKKKKKPCSKFRKTIDPKCDEQQGCKWVVGKGCKHHAT